MLMPEVVLSSFVATALKDEADATKQRNKAREARRGKGGHPKKGGARDGGG